MQLYVGSIWDFTFQLYDQSNNIALDVTAMTFECDIMSGSRRCPNILLAIGSGITVIDAVNGVMSIDLTSDQTTQIGPGPIMGAFYRTDGGRQVIWTFNGTMELPASNLAQYSRWGGYSPDYSLGVWP